MSNDRPAADNLVLYLADAVNLSLPELLHVEEAANQTLALYEEGRRVGATFSLRFGDMSGQPLFSVSLWPERVRKIAGDSVKSRILQVFVAENLDLLADPRVSVGLWYNADENLTYLDIVATLPSRLEELTLASQYDQIAVFDLQTLNEIETGGTGNTPADIPTDRERLPKIDTVSEEEP